MSTLGQCVQELWAAHAQSEEVALVQSYPRGWRERCHGEGASQRVSLAQVKEWQQELRNAMEEDEEELWQVVGINVAPFSIEETALMLLVAGQRRWTYVPIDVHLPVARQLSLLQSAGVQRLVTSVESPLAKVFASGGDGLDKDSSVKRSVVDLKSCPFLPVQVMVFPAYFFQAEESKLQCARRRLEGDGEIDAPLYVLFTSGTTGRPRGVLGTRAGAWARLEWMWTTYPFASSESGERTSERVLRATKLSFVDSVWEILGAFLKHVPLVHLQLPRQHTGNSSQHPFMSSVVLDDSALVLEVMRDECVTRFTAVPSVLEVLLLQTSLIDRESGMASLRYVLSNGESLSLHVIRQLTTNLPGVTILNLYGSTEVSGDVTCMELNAPIKSTQTADWQQHGVPIGKLDQRGVVGDETSLMLLSDDLKKNALQLNDDVPVVIWPSRNPTQSIEMGKEPITRGMLYVSGPPVALGYIGDDLEDAFVSSTALLGGSNDSKQDKRVESRRWLCTGDICSVSQGYLYFCGRKDNAVKIHGQRIYLETVERAVAAALSKTAKDARFNGSPQVIAVTTAKKVSKYAFFQKSIVACIICEDVSNTLVTRYAQTSTLNAWISEHYGASHIPHEVLIVPEHTVQRLTHGKVDRRALEKLCDHDVGDSSGSIRNLTIDCKGKDTTEKFLARLLKKVLDIPMLDGISDDFRARTFREVGGNSLLATLLAHEINLAVGVRSLQGQELLEMNIGEVLFALDFRPEKRLREASAMSTLPRSTESTAHISGVAPEGECSPVGELKRRKKTYNADGDVGHPDAIQQDRLVFVSRYNHSSMGTNGIHIPTCYASPASLADLTDPLSPSWQLRSSWQVDLGKCIDASPLVVQRRNSDDTVSSTWAIVGSHSAQLVCVDVQAAGRVIWQVTLDDRIEACAALSVRHEAVYVGTYTGTLFALDLQSGCTRWRFHAQGTIKATALVIDEHQLVVCGAYDNKLFGLDAVSGQQQWIVDLQGSIFSTPLYCSSSGQIFAASTSGNVMALQFASSDHFSNAVEQWKLRLPAPVFAGLNADCASMMLIVGCADGHLYGVDMASGVIQWQLATGKPIFSSPCIYGPGSVVFGSHDGMLRKVNSHSGELVWVANLHGSVFASPMVVRLRAGALCDPTNRHLVADEEKGGLMCCVTTTAGQIFFCDEKTGSIMYQTANSSGKAVQSADSCESTGDLGPLFGSPVLVDNWCLVGTRTNYFYGFELTATNSATSES